MWHRYRWTPKIGSDTIKIKARPGTGTQQVPTHPFALQNPLIIRESTIKSADYIFWPGTTSRLPTAGTTNLLTLLGCQPLVAGPAKPIASLISAREGNNMLLPKFERCPLQARCRCTNERTEKQATTRLLSPAIGDLLPFHLCSTSGGSKGLPSNFESSCIPTQDWIRE